SWLANELRVMILETRFMVTFFQIILLSVVVCNPNPYLSPQSNRMDSMYFLPSGISLALLLLETLICVVATVGSCLIQNIFCIFTHLLGCLFCAFLIIDHWSVGQLWYIFGFTIVIPLITEVICTIIIFTKRK
ncbi:unnamed protein product, partial [Schistosoma margrebowiei]|uniref:Transmembrane protein 107 n=1 Tax=Schistosoma margrebowiei TaxID=48269 RepID=A0AA85AGS4_9TREM